MPNWKAVPGKVDLMRDKSSSWLNGPMLPAQNEDPSSPNRWPGEKIGLTQSGEGSLATIMRRIGGLFIDWVIAALIALIITSFTHALGGQATVQLLVWAVISVVSVFFFARTPGQALLGMGVACVDTPGKRVGFLRCLARTVLTIFILPPILTDADGRGLHDRATGTAVIRG